jgi:predicted HTH domain antitoxin
MHTLTVSDFSSQPQQLLADAARGEPSLVTQDGQPLLMAIPMGAGLEAREVRLELAVALFDRDQISVGIAARIAGLSIEDMIEELGKREIAVVRYDEGELAAELDYLRSRSDHG